ncbi:DUF4168 domain-containing protein [Flavobacterium sp. CS20]|jgi:hypothetical protein|uniref:DUF4168 domain-containing protein n=1 Tax=Flavobacterium sp. CS20 TaxID=2775246 RepID=UPI001B3A5DC2|nr:DUF4168 domain-containing protein [Flavobacterium sp. CS20]QTY26504.1 DUF4168 domain-containing protein [Flavobacterium sp. CS20]
MLKTITSLILCFTTTVFVAQNQDISDQELKQFADAFQQVRMLNQSSQQKMIKAVQDEDLTVERFNLINQAEQNPNKKVEATDDELKKYKLAMQSVEAIQTEVQKQLETKIQDAGLTLERFQKISALLQNNKELQQRLTSLMQG